MDVLWNLVAGLFILAGFIGCIVPLLPGPPLAYIGLLVLQLRSDTPFSIKFMIIWALIVIVISVLDYVVPLYGTKRLGGSKYGIWGCTIGLVAGFWLGPLGIIIGPLVGAFVGEWLYTNNTEVAIKAAMGSFIGFLFGTAIKIICCGFIAYYYVQSLFG